MTDTRTRLWIGLFVLVVFLAGLGAGIVAAPWLGRDRPPERGFGRGGMRPDSRSERIVDRLSARLELSDEQTVRLGALFDARRDRLRAINREMRERLATERGTFRAAIAEILTPAQMARFEADFVRMDGRRGRPRGGSGGRGPDRRRRPVPIPR